MSAMKSRLRPSRFLFSLEKKFSADYVEMLARVEQYAMLGKPWQLEEMPILVEL